MVTVGPYDVERELGRGGMGRVLLVRHRETGALRALKVLEGSYDPESVARFRREAEALASLASKGAVPIHDSGVEAGRLWFAMAHMPGGTLAERLRARGALPWREAAALVAKLARTAAVAHSLGLVHRDVKPGNVLFDELGEPRLADFGCVRDLHASIRLTETGASYGTPLYMAPEQIDGRPATDRADVFALGVVLYETLTGRRPHEGRLPDLVRAIEHRDRPRAGSLVAVPAALDALVEQALAPRPADRPDAATFGRTLETLAAKTTPAPPGRPRSRPAIVALLVLVLAAGVAVALDSWRRDRVVAPPRGPAPAAEILSATAARLRADERAGRPLHARDLAALATSVPGEAFAIAAQTRGLVRDEGEIAELVSLSRSASPELAALGAVEELRRGRLADRAWTLACLERSRWPLARRVARGLGIADHLVLELGTAHVIASKESLAAFAADAARLKEALVRSELGDDGLDAALAPLSGSLRAYVLPLRETPVVTSSALRHVLEPLRDFEGGPRLDVLVGILIGDRAKLERTLEGSTLEADPALEVRAIGALVEELRSGKTVEETAHARGLLLRAREIVERADRAPGEREARRALLIVYVELLVQFVRHEGSNRGISGESPSALFDRTVARIVELGDEWADPRALQASWTLAQSFLSRVEWTQEREELLVGRRPQFADTWFLLALHAKGRGEVARARRHVERARSTIWRSEPPRPTPESEEVQRWLAAQPR